MKSWLMVPLSGLLLLTGCTSTSMKGTPFYTGEYEVREGPAADRVNLWPIVYYRDPAWSVLWPIMEFSPDHLAVRPVYSVHDRSSETPVYNVLWPLGRFDTANHDYRFFPVYWGDDYGVVFPLYWHKGDPVSGTGYNSLFPFWIWNNESNGSSLHVMWPLYARYDYAHRQGWHLWPLYGTKDTLDGYSRFYAWPLGKTYADSSGSGNYFIPLYGYNKNAERTWFVSLPYSWDITSKPGEKSWDLALPLWYRGWEGDTFSWSAIPALSWGVKDEGLYDNKYVAGLVRSAESKDTRSHHVLPFYLYNKNPDRTQLVSLPYSRSLTTEPGAKSWDLALPLWYRGWKGGTFSWSAIPALSWGVKDEGLYDNKYVAGLVRSAESEDARSHHVLPFYYYNQAGNASEFYSLPWLSVAKEDGSAWSASFPFYYGSRSVDGSMMLSPLYAQKWHPDGSSAWKCFIPFVYFDQTKDAHYLTLLGGSWRMGDESRWLALPLLSGGRSDADSGKTVWVAGLAGKKWNAESHSHYVFPLYYSAPEEGTFRSLVYAKWHSESEGTNSVIPILLSSKNVKGDKTKMSVVAGLVSWEKEQDELRKSSAIPFYWWEQDQYFYSAIYGLNARLKYYLTPLVGSYSGGNSGSWVFPFYRHRKETGGDIDASYLLLGKYENEKNHRTRSFWPLFKYDWNRRYAWAKADEPDASCKETDRLQSESRKLTYLVLGKNSEWWRYDTSDETDASLLSGYGKEKYFWPLFSRDLNKQYAMVDGVSKQSWVSRKSNTLVLGWSKENWRYDTEQTGDASVLSKHRKRGGLFPLWKHNLMEDVQSGNSEKTSSYLGFLYDTRHEKQSGEKEHDYQRRRVLWRLYHYEKLNGDKSTDIFPGVTIDSYKNGYYKCSVLWRLFRYEQNPEDESKKLDLLFIPLRR